MWSIIVSHYIEVSGSIWWPYLKLCWEIQYYIGLSGNLPLFVKMGSIEEKVDLESAKDQNIPFNSTQPTKKSQSFNFEANRVISPPSEVSFSSLLRKMHRISWLRSIYIVLIKAKINTLLPFGFIAIMLHRLTGKHVRTPFVILFH